MKLMIDAAADVLSLFLQDRPYHHVKLVAPNVVFHYTEAGEVAVIEVLQLSSFLDGRKLQDLDLDFTPSHGETVFEVDSPKLRAMLEEIKSRKT